MSDIAMLPQLTTLVELSTKINEIVAWTVANPVDDHVFHIALPEKCEEIGKLRAYRALGDVKGYIAGSTALYWYITESRTACSGKWKPTDGDIFFLGQEVNTHMQIGPVDLVLAKQKTVEDLLLNFDLPICRAALSFSYDFWISAQCLAALHTRKQNVPAYLKDKSTFNSMLRTALEPVVGGLHDAIHPLLYNNFVGRVKKYQDRGFGVNWINTNKIIPWVVNRFTYGKWLMTTLPDAKATVYNVDVQQPTDGCDCQHCRDIKLGKYKH